MQMDGKQVLTRFHAPLPTDAAIVQKYGGTSVGSVERIQDVADRISQMYQAGYKNLAIVVSAMSGETNRLVALARSVNPNIPGKALDMAISAGEQVSVALLGAALDGVGVPADLYLAHQLGILTTNSHTQARILSIQAEEILAGWAKGRVAVVAGFQGVSAQGDVTTLGRGGSDTSAVALAVALKADFCEINTDVDGFYSADPRLVPGARLIPVMDYETALEMASLGSKVLHSRCVEIAARHQMPIKVRSSFHRNEEIGTVVMKLNEKELIESPAVSGVTLQTGVARVVVTGIMPGTLEIEKVFAAVAAEEVNVDVIVFDSSVAGSHSGGGISFTCEESSLGVTLSALQRLISDQGWAKAKVEHQSGLSKVSIVGVGMRSYSGVASRTFSELAKQDIEIIMISTSEIKISCVIHAQKGPAAVQSLHQLFLS
jgi:aspartate kinase